jgi:uncharacterized protein YcnI
MLATPVFAHVEVTPTEATRGAKATLTFTVPNEQADANTTVVEIYLPATVGFDSVKATPPAGWQYVVTSSPGSVRFQGGTISGTDEVKFPITLTVPSSDAGDLVFKTVQTYDNGDVVRWIDPTPPGGPEPEHPAAVVKLTGAVGAATTTSTTIAAKAKSGSNKAAVAVIVALLAVVVAGVGVANSRRRST